MLDKVFVLIYHECNKLHLSKIKEIIMLVKKEESTKTVNEPLDLMSLREICDKHSYDYDYIYKKSVIKGEITPYLRGVWKLSESEVLEFSRVLKEKKLAKIRAGKGGE